MDASIEHVGGEPTVVKKTVDFNDLPDIQSRIEILHGRIEPAASSMGDIWGRLRKKSISIHSSLVELKGFKEDLSLFLQDAEKINMVFDESNDLISGVVVNTLSGKKIDIRVIEELLFKISELITEKETEEVMKSFKQQEEEKVSEEIDSEGLGEDQKEDVVESQKVKIAEIQERCGKVYSERIKYLGENMFLLWNRITGKSGKMSKEKDMLAKILKKIGRFKIRNTPNICSLDYHDVSLSYELDLDLMSRIGEYLDDLKKMLGKLEEGEFKEVLGAYITEVENIYIAVKDLFEEEPEKPEVEKVVEEEKSEYRFDVNGFEEKMYEITSDFSKVNGDVRKLGKIPDYLRTCDILGLSLSEENRTIKEYGECDDLSDAVKLSIKRSFANSRNLVIRMLGQHYTTGEDLLKKVESFKGKMKMVVVVKPLTVQKILKSGRIKSGYEEGANAVLSHNFRLETEEDMGWEGKHPIYGGVLGTGQTIRQYGLKDYGAGEFILDINKFRKHSTYILGDSISTYGLPELFKPQYEQGDMKEYRGIMERQFCFLHLPIAMVAANKIQSQSSNKAHIYVEAQIGKSPQLSDMKEIVLHKQLIGEYELRSFGYFHKEDYIEAVQKQAEEAGVKCTVLE